MKRWIVKLLASWTPSKGKAIVAEVTLQHVIVSLVERWIDEIPVSIEHGFRVHLKDVREQYETKLWEGK